MDELSPATTSQLPVHMLQSANHGHRLQGIRLERSSLQLDVMFTSEHRTPARGLRRLIQTRLRSFGRYSYLANQIGRNVASSRCGHGALTGQT
jgi:hypothetical protein